MMENSPDTSDKTVSTLPLRINSISRQIYFGLNTTHSSVSVPCKSNTLICGILWSLFCIEDPLETYATEALIDPC